MTQYHNYYFCFHNRMIWKLQKEPFGFQEKTDNNFFLLSTSVLTPILKKTISEKQAIGDFTSKPSFFSHFLSLLMCYCYHSIWISGSSSGYAFSLALAWRVLAWMWCTKEIMGRTLDILGWTNSWVVQFIFWRVTCSIGRYSTMSFTTVLQISKATTKTWTQGPLCGFQNMPNGVKFTAFNISILFSSTAWWPYAGWLPQTLFSSNGIWNWSYPTRKKQAQHGNGLCFYCQNLFMYPYGLCCRFWFLILLGGNICASCVENSEWVIGSLRLIVICSALQLCCFAAAPKFITGFRSAPSLFLRTYRMNFPIALRAR